MGIDNPNKMWFKWEALFLQACDLHDPLHTKHVRASKSPCITPELKNLKYRRDRHGLKIKALRLGDPSYWSNLKKLRYEFKNASKKIYKSPTVLKPLKLKMEIRARQGKLSMR